MKLLTNLDLDLDMSSVVWCQGQDPSGQLSAETQIELNQVLLMESRELLEASILYDLFAVREVRDQEVIIGHGATFQGCLLADRFGTAEEVALALCTVGGALDERVARYREEGDQVRAVLLDGIGTAAVGHLAEMAHQLILDVAVERGWQASAPFQPGQLDWPLEDQEVFFELLPVEKLGLCLGADHLIVPSKSVSLAVGLGREMPPLAMDRACKYCPLAGDCRFSRE